jgi:hypothetical protein
MVTAVNLDRTATGTVVSIWRYPVKSMMGEKINSSYVTEHGLRGSHIRANRQDYWQSG